MVRIKALSFIGLLALSYNVFGAADDLFSIVQVGDIHSPASDRSVSTNLIPWILQHTNDGVFNIKIFVSTGDIYEQDETLNVTTTSWLPSEETVAFSNLTQNGVMVVLCNGGHDMDYTNGQDTCFGSIEGTNYWNSLFPLSFFSNQVGYVSSLNSNDSRNIMMTYTNGVTKLAFLTYRSLATCTPESSYAAQTLWITNRAQTYFDHNVIVLAHYFVGFGLGVDMINVGQSSDPFIGYFDGTGYRNIGPALEPFADGFLACSNILMTLSGHTRSLYKGHVYKRAVDGHLIDVTEFNTQSVGGSSTKYVNVITFKPKFGRVYFRTYNWVTGRFLDNNDSELLRNYTPQNTPVGYKHNWSTPLAYPHMKSTSFTLP